MKRWWLLVVLIGISNAEGQIKKWDGEGGDGEWNNEKNWYPDGIPQSTDKIELDHSKMQGAYAIQLPTGNVTVQAYSISIEGAENDSIKLVVPELNTISPALILNDPIISLSIKNGAILINHSGAVSGNTFQLTGSMRIENGGTYLHQTIRGTAAIAAKLVIDSTCSQGKFILDVPGMAGYILSLSGRNYGTLILCADASGGKRSYSGSGNNTLEIMGDMQVLKGVSLITTLNGNIEIHRSLYNEGNIQFNPTTTDTIAKSIIFKGAQSTLTNEGIFNCNMNFKKISIDSNASLELKSNFNVAQEKTIFELNGKLICNSYYIGGLGEFITNSTAWISSTSPIVFSSNPNEGNVRVGEISIHKKTGFSFLGENVQHTGNAFPDSISGLSINKTNMLILDKPLHVSDSLNLLNGILKSDEQRALSFGGINIKSKNPYIKSDTLYNGYISGTLQFHSKTTDSILVPIGDDTGFVPCIIKTSANTVYQISYDAENHLMKVPLKYNQKSFSHWHIKNISIDDTTMKDEQISLYLGNISLNQKEQPVIIFNNNIDSNWISKPLLPFKNMDIFLQSQPIFIQDGVYAVTTQFFDALTQERIYLHKNEINGTKGLRWQMDVDFNPTQLIVERSVNGIVFQAITIKPELIKKYNNQYQIELFATDADGYFRVTAWDGERKIISNIVHLENIESIKPFPNPAFDQVYIQFEKAYDHEKFELIDIIGRKYPLNMSWNGQLACLNLEHINPGKYLLIYLQGAQSKSWPFMKN